MGIPNERQVTPYDLILGCNPLGRGADATEAAQELTNFSAMRRASHNWYLSRWRPS